MATVNWIGGSGEGNTADNWQDQTTLANRVPAAGDDVVIPDVGAVGINQTITFNGGSATVRSVTSAENLTLSGGTLVVNGELNVSGALNLSGGTLQNAIVAATSTIVGTSGTLDHVTLAGILDVTTVGNGGVNFANTVTLNNGTMLLGDAEGRRRGVLRFAGTQTLLGTGTIIVGGFSGSTIGTSTPATTVTFDTGITIRGRSVLFGYPGGGLAS